MTCAANRCNTSINTSKTVVFNQGCGVVRNRRQIPSNTKIWSRIVLSVRTPEVQLDLFCITLLSWEFLLKVQFLMELLLKQIILALYCDFHWVFVATKFLTAKINSLYVKESESEILERLKSEIFGKVRVGVGVGHLTPTPQLCFQCVLKGPEFKIKMFTFHEFGNSNVNTTMSSMLNYFCRMFFISTNVWFLQTFSPPSWRNVLDIVWNYWI